MATFKQIPRQLFVALLLVNLVAVGQANAHDQSLHKGKPIEGEIITVSANSFELKTEKGTVTVTVTGKTKLEIGENTTTKDSLIQGTKVKIYGTKLPGGKVVAKEILFDENTDRHSEQQKEKDLHIQLKTESPDDHH